MRVLELPTSKRQGQTTDEWISTIVQQLNEYSRQQVINTVPDAFAVTNFDLATDALTDLDVTAATLDDVKLILATLLVYFQQQSPTTPG